MEPNSRFLNQPKYFWANIRTIGEAVGYTDRNKGQIKTPTLLEMKASLQKVGLDSSHIADDHNRLTEFGTTLSKYFRYRANVLNRFVEPRLMNARRAKNEFEKLHAKLSPKCPIPLNKQKGDKKAPAYFTGIVNMLIEANARGLPCDYNS